MTTRETASGGRWQDLWIQTVFRRNSMSLVNMATLVWLLGFWFLPVVYGQGDIQIQSAKDAFEQAVTAYQGGDMPSAAQAWTEALGLYQAIAGTEREQANCIRNIGVALWRMGQYDAGISKQEQALKMYQSIRGTEREQANCLVVIGAALGSMGQYEAGISKQEQALKVYQAIEGTEREQANCLVNIGIGLENMSKYEAAISKQEEALKMYRTIEGTERDQAGCLMNIGVVLKSVGQYEAAISKHEEALKMYQTIRGTKRQQANCLMNLGVALCYVGQYETCIARQEQALKIFQEVNGTERQQANCLMGIGNALDDMGQCEAAISKAEQALKMLQAIKGTEWDQAVCLTNISVGLGETGQYEACISKQQDALRLYRGIKGTEREQADCLVNIGAALWNMSQYEAAISTHEQALKLYRAIKGTEPNQRKCWGNIGESHRLSGHMNEAIGAYLNAGQAWWISHSLGLAYHQRGEAADPLRALASLDRAVSEAESVRQRVIATEHRTGIFENKAVIYADMVGVLTKYAASGTQAIIPELAKPLVVPGSPTASLEAAFHYADRGKGRALLDALQEKAALKSDRADTKLLAEDKDLSLRISKLTSTRGELPDEEEERRGKLTQDIEQLQQRRNMIEVELKKMAVGGYVAPEYHKPMDMAKELPEETAVLQYSIGEKEGGLLILTRERVTAHKLAVETPALPELLPRQQATLAQLTEAWKTRKNKIGLEGLVRLARARTEDLGKRESERQNLIDASTERAILEHLGHVVLPDSALAELQKNKTAHLLVIPDGPLHYMPFAMLRVRGDKDATQYLIERYALSYTPAMATLEAIGKQKTERQQNRKGPRREVLVFANPAFEAGPGAAVTTTGGDDMVTRLRSFRNGYYQDSGLKLIPLPETEQEAMRVASLFSAPRQYKTETSQWPEGTAVVYTQKGASEDQVKRLLEAGRSEDGVRPGWRYIMFSTHGLADVRNGMLSCLALSSPEASSEEDGYLQAQEVMGLELDTDLVMLSACQTGLGRLSGGEGLVGLTGSFFYAGAESVCASLWQVPSESTSQLTTEFFKALKEGKLSRTEALRQAQLKVMREGRTLDGKTADYSSPFCWAAWGLYGEWR